MVLDYSAPAHSRHVEYHKVCVAAKFQCPFHIVHCLLKLLWRVCLLVAETCEVSPKVTLVGKRVRQFHQHVFLFAHISDVGNELRELCVVDVCLPLFLSTQQVVLASAKEHCTQHFLHVVGQ